MVNGCEIVVMVCKLFYSISRGNRNEDCGARGTATAKDHRRDAEKGGPLAVIMFRVER